MAVPSSVFRVACCTNDRCRRKEACGTPAMYHVVCYVLVALLQVSTSLKAWLRVAGSRGVKQEDEEESFNNFAARLSSASCEQRQDPDPAQVSSPCPALAQPIAPRTKGAHTCFQGLCLSKMVA